jgi:spoIIIJ-associated protein
MEWVEAVGRTVEEAVAEAMKALGEDSEDAVAVEVVEEPSKGFLGIGAREAKVKVTRKPRKKRRRSRSKASDKRRDNMDGKGGRSAKNGAERRPDSQQKGGKKKPGTENRRKNSGRRSKQEEKVAVDRSTDDKPDIEEQAQVAREFADGLLRAFGLEGNVETRIEDDVLFIEITGEQTEALVGRKGAVVQAVHELTRTVIQRKTFGAPRIRLDIAGYAARRREALKIYAGRLAENVKADGREAMLEPMNAADRKVVHDAIAEIDGVRSFSEGDEPNRSVVVAPE